MSIFLSQFGCLMIPLDQHFDSISSLIHMYLVRPRRIYWARENFGYYRTWRVRQNWQRKKISANNWSEKSWSSFSLSRIESLEVEIHSNHHFPRPVSMIIYFEKLWFLERVGYSLVNQCSFFTSFFVSINRRWRGTNLVRAWLSQGTVELFRECFGPQMWQQKKFLEFKHEVYPKEWGIKNINTSIKKIFVAEGLIHHQTSHIHCFSGIVMTVGHSRSDGRWFYDSSCQ